jgi:hypothetical protein
MGKNDSKVLSGPNTAVYSEAKNEKLLMEAAYTLKRTSNENNIAHGEPKEVQHVLRV